MMRYPEKCGKQWWLKQEKLGQLKQKEEEKKKREKEEKKKKKSKRENDGSKEDSRGMEDMG